tara:strand:- start:10560 stop:11405 length:846 start_codon:yes stop_codon:yes gene_type:complete
MSKKQKTQVESTPQVVEQPQVETMVMETPKPTRSEPTNKFINDWEIKDRRYVLRGNKAPLSYSMTTRRIYWFDEEKGYEREMQYTQNQPTLFVDEMKGDIRPGRIVFRNGVLFVPKNKVTLQKMLTLYHPGRIAIFKEVQPQVAAKNELENINLEVDALIAAREMDIDLVEAIMRVQNGSKVSKMTSKELKRDIMVFAKRNPKLLLDLMKDDNIHLRNLGIKSVEQNIIKLSDDQRTFSWESNGRKLLNVPFEEHPYSSLASWFKTDEGMEVLQSVEKQLR